MYICIINENIKLLKIICDFDTKTNFSKNKWNRIFKFNVYKLYHGVKVNDLKGTILKL